MPARGTVYFEFVPLGHQMRVTAIDAATAVEVVLAVPAATPQADMERLAIAKLRRRLATKGQKTSQADKNVRRPGIWV